MGQTSIRGKKCKAVIALSFPLPENNDFQIMLRTKRETVFERFKYRFGDGKLIICYCSDFQQKCISESHFLFIDGTFNTAPVNFKQVLVIMGQASHMNVPLSYILFKHQALKDVMNLHSEENLKS